MTSPTLKYFGAIRGVDGSIIISESPDTENSIPYKQELRMLFKKLEEYDLQPEERQKIRTQNGNWFFTSDQNRIYYATLADLQYPERFVYSFMDEVIEQFQALNDYYLETESTIKGHTYRYLPKLFEKYCDLKQVDKIGAANAHLEGITMTMNENIRKTELNAKHMQNLDEKSSNLKNLASNFYTHSDEMARIQSSNKRTAVIVAATVGTVCIGYLLIHFLF